MNITRHTVGHHAVRGLPLLILAVLCFPLRLHATAAKGFEEGFESPEIPKGWTTRGNVAVDSAEAFMNQQSLVLERAMPDAELPCFAKSPDFPLAPDLWRFQIHAKSALTSPDNSFKGTVVLQCLDAAGVSIRDIPLAEVSGDRNWERIARELEIPLGVVAGRIVVALDKTWGKFWVDGIVLAPPAAPRPARRVDRLLFSTARLGNLLFPGDAPKVKMELHALKPLQKDELRAVCTVRDYWGAEFSEPLPVRFTPTPEVGGKPRYEAELDLSHLPLEIGRYYEVHAEIALATGGFHRDWTTFAILPEAVTRQYRPEQIPFTMRNWDNRFEDYIRLTDRLGVRIAGLWAGWDAEPPYKPHASQIDVVGELGMGWLTGTPASLVEGLHPGYEKYDDKALREGMRNLLETYKVRPLIISQGNEPNLAPERIPANMHAYQTIYEAVKAVEPDVFVLGTAVGPIEEYFSAGMGTWCDGYDFHTYEDARWVRLSIERYHDLFKKHGRPKPLWSTELGLNSQGMMRHTVAVDLIRKTVNFFAAGGANMAWFGILYPDPDGQLTGTSGEAHNVFFTRYSRYCPKLEALSYYHMVNGIAVKKFVGEKTYPGDLKAFLFRDAEKRGLIVLYTEKGVQNVFLPLPGVGEVKTVQISGRRSALDASSTGGVVLGISEDPLLLAFDGGPSALPERLATPSVAVKAADTIFGGVPWIVEVSGKPADAGISAPPRCQIRKTREGDTLRFAVTMPEDSLARALEATVGLLDADGKRIGELHLRPVATGRISMRVLPAPADKEHPPGVRLLISNNGRKADKVSWTLDLLDERRMEKGDFVAPKAPTARFAVESSGSMEIAGGQTAEIVVPLTDTDPLALYKVRASLTDSSGRLFERERLFGGFVAVPRAGAMRMDGVLDEAAWQTSLPQFLDQRVQYWSYEWDRINWKGAQDLSARLKFLWDDQHLYVAATVTDDQAGDRREDDMIWAQDGLQFLVDPQRETGERVGKYDYAVAESRKGLQAWCYLSADGSAPAGQVKDFQIGVDRVADGSGAVTYEIAIPWSRVAPFKPAPGANLGLTVLLNEADAEGRKSYMTWFGNASTKQVDTVADLILQE